MLVPGLGAHRLTPGRVAGGGFPQIARREPWNRVLGARAEHSWG
jgi:hypothetical protein